jgi:hypothetical protein
MKTSKMLTMSSVGLALCCVVYLGACGKDAPSVDDLISKYNKAVACAGKTAITYTQAQKDAFNSACNSDDRKALGTAVDCLVSITCDKASASSCSTTAVTTQSCATFFGSSGLPRFDAIP